MNTSRQRRCVFVGSLALTALLVGAVVGAWVVWQTAQQRLRDPDYLSKQLARLSPTDGGRSGGAPSALVRVSVAELKSIQSQRSIVGRLVEVRKVTVASEVVGKVVELPVEEGTQCVAGETVLARIDDVWSRMALARSEAQVTWTEAQLKYELGELARLEHLRTEIAATESELEAKRAAVEELQARLKEAKATVEEEHERLIRTVIRAPFDGTVILKNAELGEHVAAGTPIVDIVSRGQIDARLMVPESVINYVRIGARLPVLIDPLGEEVVGEVVAITPYGASASRTFPVRIRLDDQQGRLKAGMSVTAMIGMGPPREALVVSKNAVLVRPDGSTVWVVLPGAKQDGFEAQPVPVTIGPRTADEYGVEPETERGRNWLVAGTQVVIEGAERLTPGQQVRIVKLDQRVAGVGDDQDDGNGSQPAAALPPASAGGDGREG